MASLTRLGAITLGYRQWTLVAIIALLVLPIVLILTFLPQIHTAYVRQFVLPGWEARFGFSHGTTKLQFGKAEYEVFAIAEVSPAGVFERAGIVPGDVPVGYQHGFEAGFYSELAQLESGHSIKLDVINAHTGVRKTVAVAAP
jgi:S1-C subfamily serine protease